MMTSQQFQSFENVDLHPTDCRGSKSRKRKLAYSDSDNCGDNRNTDTSVFNSSSPLLSVAEKSLSASQSSGEENIRVANSTQQQTNNNIECSSDCDRPVDSVSDPGIMIKQLHLDLKNEEERLRKLNMVKMYREKNNLEELGELIDKWRAVCQQSLEDLLDLLPPPRPSSKELLDHLQIDYDLVHFDSENGSFS